MGDKIISVRNISKQYSLGSKGSCKSLREELSNSFDKNIGLIKKRVNRVQNFDPDLNAFWALKNISFNVEQGEIVGIIGRNGAGKSTLLKILSRITLPTEGEIHVNGRIGSLLEVGTGFHPELTGRENIFLSGSILGMKRNEIDNKLDDIIKFSEIEKFLETPVKRYSSGMYVRLAFAVAAHLEPEILIIDEVLAVGDAQFQKKCLGKMGEVAKEGRTVLFVSHNMNAIENLCNRCMLIEKGLLKQDKDNVREVINEYLFSDSRNMAIRAWHNLKDEYNNPWFKPLKFYFVDINNNEIVRPIRNDEDITVVIEGEIRELDTQLIIGYAVYNENNDPIYWSAYIDEEEKNWGKLAKGINILKSKLPNRFLNEGEYRFELIAVSPSRFWIFTEGSNTATVILTIHGGLSDSPYWINKRPGIIAPVIKWSIEYPSK